MNTVLLLSPHLDDVAFSCGGVAATLAHDGWRVVIATAFTASLPASGFALACQLDKGLPPDIDYMALRRAEDAQAARHLGAETAWLGLPEAPHRGYDSARALFSELHGDDLIVVPLAQAIRGLIDVLTPAIVLAPQGLGGHVDHRQMIRAVLDCVPRELLAWYRDTPYAIRAPDAAPDPAIGSVHEIAVPLATEALTAKVAAATAYESQIGFQFGGPERAARALRDFAGSEGCGAPAERLGLFAPELAPVFTQHRLALA